MYTYVIVCFEPCVQPRRVPRRSFGTPANRRQNPVRSSRPHTRSRTALEGPPSPTPEEELEDRFSLVRKSQHSEDEDDEVPVC